MLHDDGKQPLQNSDFIFIQSGIDSHIQTGACLFLGYKACFIYQQYKNKKSKYATINVLLLCIN